MPARPADCPMLSRQSLRRVSQSPLDTMPGAAWTCRLRCAVDAGLICSGAPDAPVLETVAAQPLNSRAATVEAVRIQRDNIGFPWVFFRKAETVTRGCDIRGDACGEGKSSARPDLDVGLDGVGDEALVVCLVVHALDLGRRGQGGAREHHLRAQRDRRQPELPALVGG